MLCSATEGGAGGAGGAQAQAAPAQAQAARGQAAAAATKGGSDARAARRASSPVPGQESVLGSWGITMRDAVRYKERLKGHRAPTQDPPRTVRRRTENPHIYSGEIGKGTLSYLTRIYMLTTTAYIFWRDQEIGFTR